MSLHAPCRKGFVAGKPVASQGTGTALRLYTVGEDVAMAAQANCLLVSVISLQVHAQKCVCVCVSVCVCLCVYVCVCVCPCLSVHTQVSVQVSARRYRPNSCSYRLALACFFQPLSSKTPPSDQVAVSDAQDVEPRTVFPVSVRGDK